MLNQILIIINIVSAALIVAAVLLQARGSSASGVFGGDSESFYTRRGLDKVLFTSTIVLVIIFIGSVLGQLINS
ncbi:MAG: preprotein translocase subunit SecG [Candidatus Moranbacteria bacterium]|nr:preprotein translocase subunit SecG [Candidatus Moranbacteria bacterium]